MSANAKAPADAALDALVEALLPRLLERLRAQAADGDAALRDLLEGTGFEIDESALRERPQKLP